MFSVAHICPPHRNDFVASMMLVTEYLAHADLTGLHNSCRVLDVNDERLRTSEGTYRTSGPCISSSAVVIYRLPLGNKTDGTGAVEELGMGHLPTIAE